MKNKQNAIIHKVSSLTRMLQLAFMLAVPPLYAQPQDTTKTVELNEIIISAKTGINRDRQAKPNASVEEYLQTAGKVGMVKRGAYAWEPSINNMTTERISITIDGMKIFHACTDRMDPVTSYVETVNLSKVSLGSGFEANPNATNNIGGSLDLHLNRSGFCGDGFSANANSGYESNGNLWIYGADIAYANERFYLNSGYFHRNSGNYRAGGGETVRFSQFTKNNVFTNLGIVLKTGHELEGSVIYDRAADVGYPALAMDVATADGLITSLSYTRLFAGMALTKWETKVYYNNIVHIMDDTKRPPEEIVMHMDMPGESRTAGFYSTLSGNAGRHRFSLNWDGYANRSYAEMTMYPADPNEKTMFMLTWGDIRTLNTGLFFVDEYQFNHNHSLRLSAKGSLQRDGVNDKKYGWNTLQIFYPEMKQYKNRFTGNASARYRFRKDSWEANANAGYGSRAPSGSESYGYYLYNTFDAYYYLGNPHLKHESALETGLSLAWKPGALELKAEASNFYFTDYIIGKIEPELKENGLRMNYGEEGVKVYRNLPHASLLNTSLLLKYRFLNFYTLNGKATYARGRDNEGASLPLIAPFGYDVSLRFAGNRFIAEAGIIGAARQTDFNPEYGEDETKAYTVVNLSAGYSFRVKKTVFNLKAGVENLFDTYYSTYADWKNIPRRGRSVFINLGMEI